MFYKPLEHVSKVEAPVLIIAGSQDDLTPIVHTREAAALMAR